MFGRLWKDGRPVICVVERWLWWLQREWMRVGEDLDLQNPSDGCCAKPAMDDR